MELLRIWRDIKSMILHILVNQWQIILRVMTLWNPPWRSYVKSFAIPLILAQF